MSHSKLYFKCIQKDEYFLSSDFSLKARLNLLNVISWEKCPNFPEKFNWGDRIGAIGIGSPNCILCNPSAEIYTLVYENIRSGENRILSIDISSMRINFFCDVFQIQRVTT